MKAQRFVKLENCPRFVKNIDRYFSAKNAKNLVIKESSLKDKDGSIVVHCPTCAFATNRDKCRLLKV